MTYMITFEEEPYTIDRLASIAELAMHTGKTVPAVLAFMAAMDDGDEVAYFQREDAEDICQFLSQLLGDNLSESLAIRCEGKVKAVKYIR